MKSINAIQAECVAGWQNGKAEYAYEQNQKKGYVGPPVEKPEDLDTFVAKAVARASSASSSTADTTDCISQQHKENSMDTSSVSSLQRLAEQGDAESQFRFGFLYQMGEGVPKDQEQAVFWLRKAAEQGFADAQFYLGVHYASGDGVPEDGEQAAFWYQKAAEQGEAAAQFSLDCLYEDGISDTADATHHFEFDEADWKRRTSDELSSIKMWLSEASTSSSTVPLVNLAGNCLIHHQWTQAAQWFEEAARRGDEVALAELGALYMRGLGVDKDEEMATSLIKQAGNALSGLLLNDPYEFVAKLAGKEPVKMQVRREIYDENDFDTWKFIGCPCGEQIWVEIDPFDIAEQPTWSHPQWINLGNPPPNCPYDGYIEQTTTCLTYFNLEEYQRKLPKSTAQFKSDNDLLIEMKRISARLSAIRPEYRLSEKPDPEDRIAYRDMFGWVRIGGQRHKCHLSVGIAVDDNVLGIHVQVASEYDDPFRELEAASASIYKRTHGVMAAAAKMGSPLPYAAFYVSCAYGASGITDSKLIAIDQLIHHFVPPLSIIFNEEDTRGDDPAERIMALFEQELEKTEIRMIIAQLAPP